MAGRPAKPIDMAVGARTKDEIESRAAAEEKLKSAGAPKPPRTLSKNQKKIFREIVKRLGAADTLCSLDDWILAKTATAIDKLAEIDADIEATPAKKYDREVMNARAKYTQDFYRGCNELGLSPQSRAKLAISIAERETDSLLDALGDDED